MNWNLLIRAVLVGAATLALNAVADKLLGVAWNSGRDWLIYTVILITLNYFFIFRWLSK